ncbi:MAG: hypothetical protein L3J35_10295 [Bacteroidales bacterium]|nr:hypothetical protein [Bacteroidales bacterium]
MYKIIENKLVEKFSKKASFSREELFEFFKSFEPDLKEGTFGWRIYDLKKRDILKSVKKGYYAISQKQEYKACISNDIFKFSKKMAELYKDLNFCIWETSILNEFSQHQSGKNIILFEVEKDFVESVFYEFNDSFKKHDIFVNPSEKVISRYVAGSNNAVIFKQLITRSPVYEQMHKKVKTYSPYLEKILVDLYCEDRLFYFYIGSELLHIYENAIKKYSINYSRMFNYAKRRGREPEIKEYLKINFNHLVKNFIND